VNNISESFFEQLTGEDSCAYFQHDNMPAILTKLIMDLQTVFNGQIINREQWPIYWHHWGNLKLKLIEINQTICRTQKSESGDVIMIK
jgi:hypothetical protein